MWKNLGWKSQYLWPRVSNEGLFHRRIISTLLLDKGSVFFLKKRIFSSSAATYMLNCWLRDFEATFLKLEDLLVSSLRFVQVRLDPGFNFFSPQCLLFILHVCSGTTEKWMARLRPPLPRQTTVGMGVTAPLASSPIRQSLLLKLDSWLFIIIYLMSQEVIKYSVRDHCCAEWKLQNTNIVHI